MANPNYENLFYYGYQAALAQVPQEQRNCFDGRVTGIPLEGEYMSFDDTGVRTMKEKHERFAQLVYEDSEKRRRWLYPRWFWDAYRFDRQDQIALMADPANSDMIAMTYAIERKKRDVILASFNATVTGGKTPGLTSYSFTNTAISNATGRTIVHDTNNDGTAGGTSAGLTVGKLILIREKFATLDIPDGMRICLVTSFRQKSDLLREAEIQSWDTSEVKALVDGKISRYVGVEFVETNAITLGTNNDIDLNTNVFSCFAWIPEGIKYAAHLAPTFSITPLTELVGDAWQLKVNFGCNAIRTHEDMVLRIECANTTS